MTNVSSHQRDPEGRAKRICDPGQAPLAIRQGEERFGAEVRLDRMIRESGGGLADRQQHLLGHERAEQFFDRVAVLPADARHHPEQLLDGPHGDTALLHFERHPAQRGRGACPHPLFCRQLADSRVDQLVQETRARRGSAFLRAFTSILKRK